MAVAHSLHFRKAAATLGITQPALSQHIAQLERDVGTPLLLRDRRSVELTASGEVLLDGARAAMTRLEEAADQARAIGEARRRTLVVGQLDYTSHAFLPRAIFQVKERFPDALVDTRDMNPDEAIIAVREGRIDLGISLRPVDAPDLVLRDVLRGKWSLVMPKGHPARFGGHGAGQVAQRPRPAGVSAAHQPAQLLVADAAVRKGRLHAQGAPPRRGSATRARAGAAGGRACFWWATTCSASCPAVS